MQRAKSTANSPWIASGYPASSDARRERCPTERFWYGASSRLHHSFSVASIGPHLGLFVIVAADPYTIQETFSVNVENV